MRRRECQTVFPEYSKSVIRCCCQHSDPSSQQQRREDQPALPWGKMARSQPRSMKPPRPTDSSQIGSPGGQRRHGGPDAGKAVAEFRRLNAADAAAAVWRVLIQPNAGTNGARKMPPPTPVIPDKYPMPPPTISDRMNGGSAAASVSGAPRADSSISNAAMRSRPPTMGR